MRVSRLEIFGFKSFMERLILPLEGGMTGVVGPNGCGKSNIVDALRWVLGETNARSLRGGLLEDVIFSGTDKLRPLGLAEVTLTLRSEGENIFDDIATGSSEGAIEAELKEAEAQIKNVTEKLKSAIELTKPDSDADDNQIAENEIKESEAALEDSRPKLKVISGSAASTNGHHSGDYDVEKLADNSFDLVIDSNNDPLGVSIAVLEQKYGWLKGVSEVQVTRRLYRSGESEFFLNRTACRLRDLKEFFRVVGLSARTFTIVAQGEVSRIITSRADQRRQIFEEAAGIMGLRDKIATAERRLKDTAENIARLEDIEKEVERQVGSLKRQANRARQRAGLKSELTAAEEKVFKERFRRLDEAFQKVSAELDSFKSQEEELLKSHDGSAQRTERVRSELLQAEVQVEELRANLDTLKNALSERDRQQESFKARIQEIKAVKETRHSEQQKITHRISTLLERRDHSNARVKELSETEVELKNELAGLDQTADERLYKLDAEISALKDQILIAEKELQQHRQEMSRVDGELTASRKQLYADSLQELLKGNDADKLEKALGSELSGAPKLLAEMLTIEPSHIKAVQAVIGEKAAYLVVNDVLTTAASLEDLRANIDSKSKDFWYGLISATKDRSEENNAVDKADRPLPQLSDFVKVKDSELTGLVKSLFSKYYFAQSLTQALSAISGDSFKADELIVTADGRILSATICALPRTESGLLDIQQRVSELTAEQENIKNIISEKQQSIDIQNQELQKLSEEFAVVTKAKQEKDALRSELSNRLSSIKGYLDAERRSLGQIATDLHLAEQEDREIADILIALQQQGMDTSSSLELLLQDDQQKIELEVQNIALKLDERDKVRKELRAEYDQLRGSSEGEWIALEDIRRKVSSSELAIEKNRLERQHVIETAKERSLAEDLEQLLDTINDDFILSEEEFSQLEARISAIRAQILREGEVDPSSIEEYEKEAERLSKLTEQKKDLAEASRTLHNTVELLRQQSVDRFIQTFNGVRERFIQLMPRLFGGGSADLIISDINNPLESGIEIIVRPPGKKPKSLDLLSGGEKALSATALIVSLFLMRPSPLCVLDEVDAPLDEANLVRFLSLVKEMSKVTQFIVITHNKASMAAADRLVGVTMQNPGASSVLTVSLEEAFEQVA